MNQRAEQGAQTDVAARKLVGYLLDKSLGGFGPLSSAQNFVTRYLIHGGYADHVD